MEQMEAMALWCWYNETHFSNQFCFKLNTCILHYSLLAYCITCSNIVSPHIVLHIAFIYTECIGKETHRYFYNSFSVFVLDCPMSWAMMIFQFPFSSLIALNASNMITDGNRWMIPIYINYKEKFSIFKKL